MKKFLFFIFTLTTLHLQAQMLTGISTKWKETFGEWTLYTDNQEVEGDLQLRWLTNNDWTEWTYVLGEENGTIRMKWKDNPNEWEVRSGNEVVTMRTVLNHNFREWRIISNITLTWKTRYDNSFDEWELNDGNLGNFTMLTAWEGNPGDWIIEDELDENINLTTKMAMVFLVIFNSSPKF